MKILQIGPHSYVGGISIHIKRVSSILNNEFEFIYIDESPPQLTTRGQLNVRRIKDQIAIIKRIKESDLVHIHSGNWLLRLYSIFISIILKKSFIVTLHSYRITGLKASVTNKFLSRAGLIIAVSKEIKEGLTVKLRKKTIIKEAFIPPQMENESELPIEISNLIETLKNKRKFIISANAYRLTKFKDGELYGVDQCIEVAKLAKKEDLSLHIIFIIGTVKDEDREYYITFTDSIKENNLQSFITIIPEKISFVKLIQLSDLVIRPTLSDGDALTIREALCLGKKVLASDIVERPNNVILYKTGNSTDLYLRIKELTKEDSQTKYESKSVEIYKQEYSEIYNKCNN